MYCFLIDLNCKTRCVAKHGPHVQRLKSMTSHMLSCAWRLVGRNMAQSFSTLVSGI